MRRRERAELVVACTDCELRTGIDTPNEAVSFYRRHRSITGHDVDRVRADVDLTEGVATGGPRTIIAALESEFAAGAPIGVITAVMSERNGTIDGTLVAIHELRMAGELYEPRDDHLRVT